MQQVLSVIAPEATPLRKAELAAVRDALAGLGAETLPPDWLAADVAADIPFSGLDADQAEAAARAALAAPRDVIAQAAQGRRKKLLLADMDSTIVTSETLDEMAAFAGLKEKIAAITARAMNGELDFAAALRERVAMLKGLPLDALERTWAATVLTPGARALVATMQAHGAFCALVSGGFTFFTSRVRALVGFDLDQANFLEIDGGVLAGRVAEPILDRDAKLAALRRLAAERGLSLAETCTVGDGANDLPMLKAAGLGVAFHAKPSVAAAARVRIDHGDLSALLFAQGFRADEFRG
ncbi:MAG: phosphoserine phosphatase SerB [Acetobacteraceae bacterium]|nr:phosphoserine phosphatase SerB [Acetobacteraceae bacterium]